MQAANSDLAVDACFAGSDSNTDTIVFDVSGTILLDAAIDPIDTDLIIDGTGQAITISGRDTTSIMSVDVGGRVDLLELTITDGDAQACPDSSPCGAVLNGGILNVVWVTFSGNNSAGGNGAAITNDQGGQLNVSYSTFVNNTASNAGGAIWNRNGDADITNSTFVSNFAAFGGAIHNNVAPATTVITNSTFSTNGAEVGVIENANPDPGSMLLRNTIIESTIGFDCAGTIAADGFNIDGDGTCDSATTSSSLNLQPLADNGGPTQTVALGAGSAAYDAADLTVCLASPVSGVDQRGQVRPQGAGCDSGAYESNGSASSVAITIDTLVDDNVVNGNCTLREAILAANSDAPVDACIGGSGTDTIDFNLTGAGPHTISPTSPLPPITGPLTIDGHSQPGASANTLGVGSDAVILIELDGSSAGGGANGLDFSDPGSDGSAVQGLAINRFNGYAIVAGPATRIRGNHIGTDPAGTTARANTRGVLVDTAATQPVTIGGTTPADRNVISGNNLIGVQVLAVGGTTAGTTILGNYIGTDASGTAALPNGSEGIWVGASAGALVTGTAIGDGTTVGRNVISGNSGEGIAMWENSTLTVIRGNYIGVGADGTTPLGNALSGCPECFGGIVIRNNITNNTIGGNLPGDGNVIANNPTGIIAFSGLNNRFVGNSIFDNLGNGLEIGVVGPNDPGDPDVGANNAQNYPVVVPAIDTGNLVIDYSIDSADANSAYPIQIDVYAADNVVSGEGKTLLGRTSIAAPGSSSVDLGDATTLGVALGDPIVATATDANGNTSNFSTVASIDVPGVPANKVVPNVVDLTKFGSSVSIDGDWAAVGQPGEVGDPGAVSVLQRDPLAGSWSIVQTIEDPTRFDFGISVALDGNTLAIAANVPGGAGEVQVLDRPDAATPFAVSILIGSSVGAAIDLSGDDLIIGIDSVSFGAVDIWSRASGSWQLELGTSGGPGFGYDVAIDGDLAAVSDTSNLTAGQVIVYQRSGATWTAVETLSNPDAVTSGDAWFGSAIALQGSTLVVGHSLNDDPDLDEGSVWVYDGAPGSFDGTEVKLTGTPTGTGDVFGQSVDIGGDWIVVGAPAHNESGVAARAGAAFVFNRDGGAWSQTDFILAGDRNDEDLFGGSVAVTDAGGDAVLLVGGPNDDNIAGIGVGAVYSFEAVLMVPGKILNPTPDLDDFFGTNVDIDGTTMVVGAYLDDGVAVNAGAAYVYEKIGGVWTFQQSLDGATLNSGDNFGFDVAVDGDLIVVATATTGAMITYRRSGGVWTLSEELTIAGASSTYSVDMDGGRVLISDAFGDNVYLYDDNGSALVNQVALPDPSGVPGGFYGYEVGIAGDVIVVGAPFQTNAAGSSAGAAYIWEYDGLAWQPSLSPQPPDLGPNGRFGHGISVSGETVAIGYLGATLGPDTPGGVGIVSSSGGAWVYEQTLVGSASATGTIAGLRASVSIDGESIAFGNAREDSTGGTDAGATYVFQRQGGGWVEVERYVAPDGGAGDLFGISTALSGDDLAVGAVLDPVHEGAVYVFDAPPPPPVDGRILAPDAAAGDYFGQSVDIHDDWMVVGARHGDGVSADTGSAYVFRRDFAGGDWNFVTEFTAADGTTDQWFGYSVAVSGTRFDDDGDLGNFVIAVGAPDLFGTTDGAVYLYRYDFVADNWAFTRKVDGPVGSFDFGFSVALEQTSDAFRNGTYTLAAGAPGLFTPANPGAAYLYRYTVTENPIFNDSLILIDTADSPTPAPGAKHGFAVALDGDSLIVSEANAPDGALLDVGRAHVYRYDATSVLIEGTLTQPPGDVVDGDNFGRTVDIDGDLAVVGSLFDLSGGPGAGAAYVYRRDGSTWGVAEQLVSQAVDTANFGVQARVEDGIVAVSAFDGGSNNAGTVQTFEFDISDGWVTGPAYEWAGGTVDTNAGSGLALGEDGVLAVGSAEADNVGGVNAGAVQVFDVNIPLAGNKLTTAQDIDLALFGADVDVDGEWAIVGATGAGDGAEGSAFMFRKVAGEWQLFQELDDLFNPIGPGDDYGVAVAVGGDYAAIADQGDETSVYWFNGTSWVFSGDFFSPGFASNYFVDLDIDGANDRLIVGYAFPGAVTGQVEIYDLVPSGQPQVHLVFEPGASSGTLYARSVAIEGDLAFASAERDNGNDGSVVVFERSGTDWTEIQSITPPVGAAQLFGSDLDVDGNRLIVGQSVASRAWVFENVSGTWGNPIELNSSGSQGGRAVSISGDLAIVGAPRATIDGLWAGSADVFARAGSTWVLADTVSAADREFADAFASVVSLDGSSLFVGAPFDTNIDGVIAGGAYVYDVEQPDNPTLDFTLNLADGQLPPIVADGEGIAISRLSATTPLIEKKASTSGGVGSTALDATGVAESALAGTKLGDTQFGDIAVSNDELADLPILSIGLDLTDGDDWPQILDTDEFRDRPIVNITVGEVFGSNDDALRGTLDAIPFGAIDVGGTPFGAIPFGAIALGDVPLLQVPPGPDLNDVTEIEAAWCDILEGSSEACESDVLDPEATLLSISLSDVPFGAIPFGAIPFGAIPVEDAPFGAIALEEVKIEDTPFGAIPFGAIDINASPFGAIPFGAIGAESIPFGAIPYGAIQIDGTTLGEIPFGAIDAPDAIPFGAIDVNGAPFGAIPFGAIALADVNLADIPLDPDRTTAAEVEQDWCTLMAEFGLDCTNGPTSVATTTVTDLGVRGVPFGAIPFGAIPYGAIPFGAIDFDSIPFGAIPFGAIPFGAINLNAVDVNDIDLDGTPFGAIPFGAIPFGAISTSVGAIPFGAIDVQGSPFGAIRLDDISTDSIPFGAIPFGAIPFGAISPDGVPFGAIPFGAIPFGAIGTTNTNVDAIPFGAIDLVDSPFGAIPFGAIPFGAIGSIVDCDAIDCDSNATLRDAFFAGAINPDATLADLGGAIDNFRLPDLAEHLLGIDAQELYDPVFDWGDNQTLADLTAYANMTLGDLPADNSFFRRTVLNDVKAGLSTVTFEDLALALLISNVPDPALELENVVDSFGNALTLADFGTFGDTTFSELLPALASQTLGDLGTFLAFIRLGELGFTTAEVTAALSDAGTSGGPWLVSDAVNDADLGLGDMRIADIIGAPQWGAATVLDLVNSLPADEVAGFTFSDLLLGMLPPGALPWGLAFEKIDADEIPGVMPPVTLESEFALTGTRQRSVEVSVELPTNAAYLPGTTTVERPVAGALTPLGSDVEPDEVDGRLVWTFSGIEPGPDAGTPGETYTMTFDVQPSLAIGSTTINADSRIIGSPSSVASTTLLQVLEAFEPNDVPADAIAVAEDVIYLVHIPDEDDVDLFSVTLAENDALAVDLSGLPADFDVVIYRETTGPVSSTALSRTTPAEPLVPLLDPDSDGSETVPDQSFPRFDLDDSNLSLIEVSNSRGLAKETIVTDRLPAGRYLIQVHGHDGAHSVEPSVLQINIVEAGVVPECAVRGALPAATPGASVNLTNLPADLNTVILLNEMRFEQIYGADGREQVTSSLAELVTAMGSDPEISTLGLSAVVVPVDSIAAIRAAYDFLDNPEQNGGIAEDACNPNTANDVVSKIISEILDPIRDVRDIENIVLVGSDDLLPFGRLSDSTQTANEFDYRNDLNGRNAFTGTFWSSSFLSDDPYADTGALPYGDRFLYVPDAALGRVLESPEQIAGQIEQFITFDGFLAAETGLIAGYDFLIDGSEAIAGELSADGAIPIVDDELADGINAAGLAWTAVDIETALLGNVPNGENGFDLVSFNAHFDHHRALPAEGDQVSGFEDNFETSSISSLAPADPRLDGTIIFSMGCHSGLNVPNLGVGVTGVTEDWAEVLTAQRAIYIGNTGFGYGDTETVGYTERLMQLFARNISSPVATNLTDPSTTTSIGDAMRFAKQEAFSELGDISVYHEKAYQESTFYGLPFFRVGVAPQLPQPPPDNEPEVDEQTGSAAATFVSEPQNKPNVVETVVDGVVVKTETYYSNLNGAGDPVTITQPGRPIQPGVSIDVSDVDPGDSRLLEREARGAMILDMTSTYVAVDPVLSVPVFDESSQAPEPRREDIVYPTVPQRISTFERPDGTRQNLVLATGQYRGTESLGSQRLDDDIEIVVYYSDPSETDRSAPRILGVDTGLDGRELSITARVEDAGVVDRVYILVTPSPNLASAEWIGRDLVDVGDGVWVGGVTFATAPEEIELLVQAKDQVGNVGVSTNKARNFGDETLPPPPVSTLTTTLTADPAGPLVNGYYTGPVTVKADAGGTPISYQLNGSGGFLDLDLQNGVVVTGDRRHTIEIVAIDGQKTSRPVKIDTLAPAATISKPASQARYLPGQVVKSSFQCFDASGATCSGVVTKDGSVVASLSSGQSLPTSTPGTYLLTVTATDPVGRIGSATRSYIVSAPPAIVSIHVPGTPQLITDGVDVDVEFTDADGAAESYKVVIDYGDADPDDPLDASMTCTVSSGTPSVLGGGGAPSCELTHEPDGAGGLGTVTSNFVYPRPGVFVITVAVEDGAGNVTTWRYDDYVVVYDPGAGRVSGSGKFWSADSSYVDDDTEGEWAHFGYRARYKHDDPMPEGKTKLKLKGDFKFKSTSYDYLIVNDAMAVAEGLGEIDGDGGYRFRVQGIDYGSTDFFQITIWEDADPGNVIYDNGVIFDETGNSNGDEVLTGGIKIKP